MLAVVFETATSDEQETAKALEKEGFIRVGAWIKPVPDEEKLETEAQLRGLGVAQFAVTDYWGRGPG